MIGYTAPPSNEVGRVVIHLPDDATFYRDRSYLPIAIDLVDGTQIPSLLRSDSHGIDYMAGYEIFSALCSARAQRTVDRSLLVDNAPITPERYLGLWRSAIGNSMPPQAASKTFGIQAVAVLQAPLADLAGARSSWTSCPFGAFETFQDKYRRELNVSSDGVFTLELDLARPGAARDAYYAASMVSTRLRHGSTAWRASIELRTSPRGTGQVSLFAVVEA
jgi:hypothetical protein